MSTSCVFDDADKLTRLIYDELRCVADITDKIAISAIVLTASYSQYDFADLLYSNQNLDYWVSRTNRFFQNKTPNNIDKSTYIDAINANKAMEDIFLKFITAIRKAYDKDGLYKALFNKDEYAIATVEIFDVIKSKNWEEIK